MPYVETKMLISSAWKAQIALFLAEKVNILVKYLDFVDKVLKKLLVELFKSSIINRYLIHLELGKQPLYWPIYSLRAVKLEILNTNIKPDLINSFIQSSKSLTKTTLLFVKKPDGSFRLCMDYQCLNNLTIKNQYLLSLIDELLN